MLLSDPTAILDFFHTHYEVGKRYTEVQQLNGDVNRTFRLSTKENENIIFQRLSKIFDERVVNDFEEISTHLTSQGWDVPTLCLTKDAQFTVTDEDGNLWRAMSFIDIPDAPNLSDIDYQALGCLLAKFHSSLESLEYSLQFSLPHFHDTAYYYSKFQTIKHALSDMAQAELITNKFDSLEELPAVSSQIIHGDLRVDNIIFQSNKPYTFIDFDTVMNGTIWIEIGDLVRGLIEKDIEYDRVTDFVALKNFSDTYLINANFDMKKKEFFTNVLLATKRIALELSMRFAIDIVEDYYFVWQNTPYDSRKEHNAARIKQQLMICERIEGYGQKH